MTHPGKNDKLRTVIVEDNTFFRQSLKERLEALFLVMGRREKKDEIKFIGIISFL